jgi:leucyl aminopeptidase (aminopeptidase T)
MGGEVLVSLKNAVWSAIRDCLSVAKNERALVLCDETRMELALSFHEALGGAARETSLLAVSSDPEAFERPSRGLVALMTEFDAVVLLTRRSCIHTEARRQSNRHGTRFLCLSGATAEGLCRTMTGKYLPIVEKSRKIADIFTIGKQGFLTTPAGTSLQFSIARMRGFADTGIADGPGTMACAPGGEGSVSPMPESVNGQIVIDGSFPEIGPLSRPLILTIRNGSIRRVSGGKEADRLKALLRRHGKPGRMVAEVGVGTNPYAVLTGTTLEDEKVLGTAHVAFGDSQSFDGKNAATIHMDGILLKPTLDVDGKRIVENGVINV